MEFHITNHARDRWKERFSTYDNSPLWRMIEKSTLADKNIRKKIEAQTIKETRKIPSKDDYYFIYKHIVFACIIENGKYVVQTCFRLKQSYEEMMGEIDLYYNSLDKVIKLKNKGIVHECYKQPTKCLSR
jgi:hypothetical protein